MAFNNYFPRYMQNMNRNISLGMRNACLDNHYSDVMMNAMVSQTIGVSIVYSIVCSDLDQTNVKAPRHWPL